MSDEYCDQDFYIQDNEGYPIWKAKVNFGGSINYETGANGWVTIRDLHIGWSYTATVSKEGHTAKSVQFTGCRSCITVTLTKVAQYCNQDFYVQDTDGYPIRGAEIDLGGTIFYTTDPAGACTIQDLHEGWEYTATAKKAGYSGEPTQTFTACRSQIVFTLSRTHAVLTFRAQTPERVAQPNAKVTLQPGNHECTTDSYGECTIAIQPPYLGEAIASHANFRDSYPEDLDIDTIKEYDLIFLRLMPPICSQLFVVAAEDGTLLQDAEVLMRDGETEEYIDRAVTDSNGECRIYFTARYYKAKATCEGYKSQQHPKSECNPGSTVHFYLPPDIAQPETGMAQSIVKQNGIAMAEAVISRYDGLTLPGYSEPPYRCPICGESFNSATDFINHTGEHIRAYEVLVKEWS